MSIKSRVFAVTATLTMVGVVSTAGTLSTSTVGTLPASAATPECGESCISVFSRALGTHIQPTFVEAVLDGVARVGQPVILKRASNSDPSEDLIPDLRPVPAFFAAGMVSADVNRHYGNLDAVQIRYAPLGEDSGLCVGLATAAFQNEGLTLQTCTVPATTVWIIDTADSPATAPDGFFPLVNGSTRNFSRPFVMTYPRNAFPTDEPTPHIHVRHLKLLGNEHTVPDRQLWGARPGVLP